MTTETPSQRAGAQDGELCLFAIHEEAERDGISARLVDVITGPCRMDVIGNFRLDAEAQSRFADALAKEMIPGFADGGLPSRIVAAFDYYPAISAPHFTNAHLATAKRDSRWIVLRTRFFHRLYDGLFAADNESSAAALLRAVLPQGAERIGVEILKRRERYITRFPVQQILSKGRRAKVELIEFEGARAIKKTFGIGSERFFERELMAARDLAPDLSFIPPLLDHGDGYLVVPYYENVLAGMDARMLQATLARHRKDVFAVIHEMYRRGLTLIDFDPKNILITPDGRFLVLDYEFLQPYKTRPYSIDGAYEVAGHPHDFDGDFPFNFGAGTRSFRQIWAPYVGDWESLKHDFFPREAFKTGSKTFA